MFQAHRVLSLPPFWKWLFLQVSLIPFSGEWYLEKNQALGIVAPRSCDWTKLGNIYNSFTLLYTYLYLFLCLYTRKTRSSHRYIQLQSGTTGFILVFSLSIFVTAFSNSEKPTSHYLICLLIWSLPLYITSCCPFSLSHADVLPTHLRLWYPVLGHPFSTWSPSLSCLGFNSVLGHCTPRPPSPHTHIYTVARVTTLFSPPNGFSTELFRKIKRKGKALQLI